MLAHWPELCSQTAHSAKLAGITMKLLCEVSMRWLLLCSSKLYFVTFVLLYYTHLLFRNYTLRVMPLPLGDIGRAGKGVEEHVQSMQQCLCRNHSDERLKVEIAARHRTRLLTANQQSVSEGRLGGGLD